ncbi:hypothetical protein B0H67DRAFT_350495 [Lasiosphaeris hirsuta]|uniref:CHAT domain-containing protein n=1 Tax=Lasiosphaeris hirsuta TaxID=260670 RepID=A0AA40DI76_9PEZI|nr:hypothetical protein B0H67DRAFT_350495 [Lasiosphaeris hirsuta]
MVFEFQTLKMESSIIIHETESETDSGWSFEVSDLPGKLSFPTPATEDEDLLRWYLQTYPLEEPFDNAKADRARDYLARYSSLLRDRIPKPIDGAANGRFQNVRILERDVESSAFHSLHWEVLEQTGERLSADETSVRVSRTVECSAMLAHNWVDDLIPLRGSKTFNILLFVSRPDILDREKDDVSHRLAVRPLFSIAGSFPDDLISIEVARPGTWQGLRQHLEDAAARGKFFHLVHLDVHGSASSSGSGVTRGKKSAQKAKLHFLPDSFGDYGKVSAAQVAKQLRSYKIPAVVLNACESARSDSGLQANLAKVFVAAGIPLVVAMSYKVLESAASIFMGQFYRSLLLDRLCFAASAAEGRRALRENRRRIGMFGIPLDLVDWFVPVTYMSTSPSFEAEYSALVPLTSEERRAALDIRGLANAEVDDFASTSSASSVSSRGLHLGPLPTFEADIFRAETLLLTREKNVLLVEEDLGAGKERFFEQAANWWRESGLTKSTVHVQWRDDQNTPPTSDNLLYGAKVQLFGERMGMVHESIKSLPDFLNTVLEFLQLNTMLQEHDPKPRRSTCMDNMIILDGIPLHLISGTTAVMNPLIPMLIHNLAASNAAVCVGSHTALGTLASVLDDVPIMTLSGKSDQLFSRTGVQHYLQNPRQWHLLQSMLGWAWHLPAFEALVRRAIATYGLEDAYALLATNLDILGWVAKSSSEADRIAESLPGYRLARVVFNSLPAADQDQLLVLALFSNAAPVDPETFMHFISERKHHLRSTAQRAVRSVKSMFKKLPGPFRGGSAELTTAKTPTNTTDLLGFLAVHGLVDHREFYGAFNWDGEKKKLSASAVYARFHPGLALFLRRSAIAPILSTRRLGRLNDDFLAYHQNRLEVLLAEQLPAPLREAKAAGEGADIDTLFEYNAQKEVEWGLWNFFVAMEHWKATIDRGQSDDVSYAQLFYNFFMERQPLQYQFLDDPFMIQTAVDVVFLLAPVHDRTLREWYSCEHKITLRALHGNPPGEQDAEVFKTAITLPRAYWAVFDLVFSCVNWLCRSFRHREDHVEFNCWVKICVLLLHAMDVVHDKRADEMAMFQNVQDQLVKQNLPVQIRAAKEIVGLQLKWPNAGLEADFSEMGVLGEIRELAPLGDFMKRFGAVVRRGRMWGFVSDESVERAMATVNAQLGDMASAIANGIPTFLARLSSRQLLQMRLVGWDPDDDGVPWPADEGAPEAEETYRLIKRDRLLLVQAAPFSKALARMRKEKCGWEGVREEYEAASARWLKIDWPRLLLNVAERGQHGRQQNKFQAQALIWKEEWTGCLAYLDLVASDLDPALDRAFWVLCRTTCLLRLGSAEEAAKHALKAFELCVGSEDNEAEPFFDLLHNLYRLLQSWPGDQDGAASECLPSRADVLLLALKTGYCEYAHQQQVYARNGTLLFLFLQLIDPHLANIKSLEGKGELLDFDEIPNASDAEFRRKVAELSPGAAFTEEELREGSDKSLLDVLFEANLVQTAVGDLNRSLRWLDSTISYHLSVGGSKYMKSRLADRVLRVKGRLAPKKESEESNKGKNREGDGVDESSLEFQYMKPSEDADDGDTGGNVQALPEKFDIQNSYATEVLELLLQARSRIRDIRAKTIMDMAKRRWIMPLDWRREHHVLATAFLGSLNSDEGTSVWKRMERDLMGAM